VLCASTREMATAAPLEPRSQRSQALLPGLAGRLLALTAEGDGGRPAAAVHAFALIALFHLATERVGTALVHNGLPGIAPGLLLVAVAVAAACVAALVLGFDPERLRMAVSLGLVAQLLFIALTFPHNANHDFLLVLSLALLVGFDVGDAHERRVLVACVRWLAIAVLFATGVQKLMYGTYFLGDYIGFRVAHSDTFAAVFQYLLPPDEFLRLRSLGHDPTTTGLALFSGRRIGSLPAPGAGPYQVFFLPFLAISNSVWIFEMGAPLLLLWRRTRRWAALATIAFLAAIEVGAREYFFGLLFANLLLLFLPGRWHQRSRPVFAVAYLGLVLRQGLIFYGWVGA
jgi:hypothetical protein